MKPLKSEQKKATKKEETALEQSAEKQDTSVQNLTNLLAVTLEFYLEIWEIH